ncbi:MAG: hypothetical protein PHH14_00080 [Candidatus Margulisbacteria bacterium]|nr:hypothetical protein [Candidatus Margulisiibacteriota bacterium]
MLSNSIYSQPIGKARSKIEHGPIGIPEKARSAHYSAEEIKVKILAKKRLTAYFVPFGNQELPVKLDAAISETARAIFIAQFANLGRLNDAGLTAAALHDGITIWSVGRSPSLVQKIGANGFAVNSFYFDLTAFLFSTAPVFKTRKTCIQYPQIKLADDFQIEWYPQPFWLPGKTRFVFRPGLNQALQALVLPIFASVVLGDCSLEQFLGRAHQLMTIYGKKIDKLDGRVSGATYLSGSSMDLPQLTRVLWEYVGSFVFDSYFADRLWTASNIERLWRYDNQRQSFDLPDEYAAESADFQLGYRQAIEMIRDCFMSGSEAREAMAKTQNDPALTDQNKLGRLRAFWEFARGEKRIYAGKRQDDYWDDYCNLYVSPYSLVSERVNERPNRRHCYNVWRPGEQLIIRDEATANYRKLSAVFGQLTVARWGHVNSEEHRESLYEDERLIPKAADLEQLINILYRDFDHADIQNAVLAVMRGYETENGQKFGYRLDLGKYSNHEMIDPLLRQEQSMYRQSRPFRGLWIGDSGVLWAHWLLDREAKNYGYPLPSFDRLLGRPGEKSKIIPYYDGMQLLDSQPLFFDPDFMRIISVKDVALFDRIIDLLKSQRALNYGEYEQKRKFEFNGETKEVILLGRGKLDLLELIKLAYPEIFELIKARAPELAAPQGMVARLVFDQTSLAAEGNPPEVFNAFLLGKLRVAPEGTLVPAG